MKRQLLVLFLVLNFSFTAQAEENLVTEEFKVNWENRFENGVLFFLKGLEASSHIGVDFGVSPFEIAKNKVLNDLKNQNPEAFKALEDNRDKYKPHLETYKKSNKGEDEKYNELKAQLKAAVKGDKKAEKWVEDNVTKDNVSQTVTALEQIDSALENESSYTIAIKPFVKLWLEPMMLGLDFPLAYVLTGDEGSFNLGNIGLWTNYYIPFGQTIPIHLTLGFGLNIPTASKKADKFSQANPTLYSDYSQGYFTMGPSLGFGFDLEYFLFHSELSSYFSVPVEDGLSDRSYLKYGLSGILSPIDLINIVAEMMYYQGLNGFDESSFDAMFLALGLRLDFLGFKPGLAIQMPVIRDEKGSVATSSSDYSNNVDKLAKFNILFTLAWEL